MSKQKEGRRDSTLAALLQEKPKRGRPRRAVSRQNVYVGLSPEQKACLRELADSLPAGLGRADIPDLAISLLATRLELLRRAVADRNREIPEGVTDMDSLYLLWDLPLPVRAEQIEWTSVRASPQQAIELGRVHGTLNALFGANRSQVFALALALFASFYRKEIASRSFQSVKEVRDYMSRIYL
jgi:hypothetical protein